MSLSHEIHDVSPHATTNESLKGMISSALAMIVQIIAPIHGMTDGGIAIDDFRTKAVQMKRANSDKQS